MYSYGLYSQGITICREWRVTRSCRRRACRPSMPVARRAARQSLAASPRCPVYGHVYGHVYGCVYGHVYAHG